MIAVIAKQLSIRAKRTFYPGGKGKLLVIGDISLKINQHDDGGKQYDSRKSFEERYNPFYTLLKNDLNPGLFVDIGANYGFISTIISKYLPQAKLMLVEPGKMLGEYIKENMRINKIDNYELTEAICGPEQKDNLRFSINPYSSQDNRVVAPKKSWKTEEKKMVSLDGLLENVSPETKVFIKIDVQGFEEMVLSGATHFLSRHSNWLMKIEFAPQWISSQNSDPLRLLKNITEKYKVVELTGRTSYNCKSIHEIFQHPLQQEELEGFLQHVTSLDKNGRGWCDLLIAPTSLF